MGHHSQRSPYRDSPHVLRGVNALSDAHSASLSRRLAISLTQRARASQGHTVFFAGDELRSLLADPDIECVELDPLSGLVVGGVRVVDVEARLAALERPGFAR